VQAVNVVIIIIIIIILGVKLNEEETDTRNMQQGNLT
jgi:hypothetical protein